MLIASIAPTARHAREIAAHPLVDGLRINTGSRTLKGKKETLQRMLDYAAKADGGVKPLWVDLKARQLRITKWADPRYEVIELNHRIQVELGAKIWFRDFSPAGEHASVIVEVEGNKIVIDRAPRYAVGAGQSVNIRDPSLVVEGYLTENDCEYVAAARELGLHRYLLSFFEQEQDLNDLLALDPEAQAVAKIENPAGLAFVRSNYPPAGPAKLGLMAARDDLYLHIGELKTAMFEAEELIIQRDPEAIAASRILTSLQERSEVALGDLKDLESLMRQGYRNFMLSDGLCENAEAFSRAMQVYEQFMDFMAERKGATD